MSQHLSERSQNVSGRSIPPVSEVERARLLETFVSLCKVPSPSGQEKRCGEYVTQQLENLGLEVIEDDAAHTANSGCGNILARTGGARRGQANSPQTVLLCAHIDTVQPQAPIEPEVNNGYIQNRHAGIIGVDNKAAVAVLLELAKKVTAQGSPMDLELLFTVSEERGLAGAKNFDFGCLTSKFGFVFDNASPLGGIVTATPDYYRIEASFLGKAAHAGLNPESGRSALLAAAHAMVKMPHGRIDSETTVNVGYLTGGDRLPNTVPERCQLIAEVRGMSSERAEGAVTDVVDALHAGANTAECDVDITCEQLFRGYSIDGSSVALEVANQALSNFGVQPKTIQTGGGSDANALRQSGFDCINLTNGAENIHEPGERISIEGLSKLYDLALTLVDTSARQNSLDQKVHV